MSQVHVIRHKVLVEGISIRKAARDVGVSRNTARKYLNQSEPIRIETEARVRPVFDQVKARMDELLKEWSKRTTKKQRVTGSRLHKELVADGHEVGISLVRDYLRKKRHSKREVMVPLVWEPGDAGQVDFFEVTVDIGGHRRKAWMFLLRMMHSGRDFVWLYDRCDQVSFLDAHVRAFAHLGAVPQRLIYDNLKPAVAKIVGANRKLTGRFLVLVSHYLFEPCFARPGEGHDKGGVESRGKAIRLQHLTPVPQGESLVEISAALLAQVDGDMLRPRHGRKELVSTLFEEELPLMLEVNAVVFESRATKVASVYSTSKARILNSWYSVPTWWSRTEVTALVGVDEIELQQRGNSVVHPRKTPGESSIRYRHYLPELSRKPQALRQVVSKLLPELGEPFGELWAILVECHGPRDAARAFAKVVAAIVDHDETQVTAAVANAIRVDDTGLSFLTKLYAKPATKLAAVPEALAQYEVQTVRATDFDSILIAGGVS